MIFVDTIPNIPLGKMSNDISIKLKKPVPYNINLKSSSLKIDFILAYKVFVPHKAQSQTLRVSSIKNSAKPGSYAIAWVKVESTSSDRLPEVVDTYFDATSQSDCRQLELTVNQSLYRANVGAQ